MKLNIEMDLEQVKYGDDYDREEIGTLLLGVARRIANWDVPVAAGGKSNIRDVNGNTIGMLTFTDYNDEDDDLDAYVAEKVAEANTPGYIPGIDPA